MATQISRRLKIPSQTSFLAPGNVPTNPWAEFFQKVYEVLDPLSEERSFELANNVSSPTDIVGLSFGKAGVSFAAVDYLIQRVTSSSEMIECGTFYVAYRPDAEDWEIVLPAALAPDDAGVDLTITASGQVRYTSTNQAGTGVLSRLVVRSRILAAKAALYSTAGASR